MKAVVYRIIRRCFYLHLVAQTFYQDFLSNRRRQITPSVPLASDYALGEMRYGTRYQSLKAHYTTQFNEAACSVASVAMVVNAARQIQSPLKQNSVVTQLDLLEGAGWDEWKARVAQSGHHGRRGLPIEKLGWAMVKSFKQYAIPIAELEVVPVDPENPHLERLKNDLRGRLIEFEADQRCFIVAHFSQGAYVKGLHIPHISPVGAYDRERQRVLLLDVDPDQKNFYWVDVDTFFYGLAFEYSWFIKRAGYTGGGYIWIRLRA